ncbi:MauE/DoxX family redox-associated membrane protein [Nonomuraea sp. NPDC049141]|uniref:MauE/DoxX family redox-associated membrane protein n=1 Tax=Nonomuraea sp. NPDC049141 TaxID=3155500 RepID=UPI0033FF794D
MHYLALLSRCLIAGVLVLAVVSKLRGPTDVESAVSELLKVARQPVGRRLVRLLIAAELGVAALVIAPGTAPAGLAAATVLMWGFAAFVAMIVRQRRRIPCPCFGPSRTPLGPVHVVRNVALGAVAAAGAAALAYAPATALQPGEVVVTLIAAALGVCLAAFSDDVHALFSDPTRT